MLITGPDDDPFHTNITDMDLEISTSIDGKFEIDEKDEEKITLGEGRFSVVYRGHKVQGQNQMKVAIKVLAPFEAGNAEGEDVARREELAETLNHRNIVKVLHKKTVEIEKDTDDKTTTYKILHVVMEYCKYGLVGYIREQEPPSENRLSLLLQFMNALHYLHGLNIMHCDIKPDNILIKEFRDRVTIKLADFGLSEHNPDQTVLLRQKVGTRPFWSPEMHQDSGYSFSSDIFAAALVCLTTMVCYNKEVNQCNTQYCNFCRKLCLFEGNSSSMLQYMYHFI